MRERDVMGREKKLNFGNEITEILAAQKYCPSECEVPEVLALGGVPRGKPIVATKLPKLQEREERENINCGNQVAENGRKKKKIQQPKKLWQWHCRNGGEKKNCGNGIAEIEGKKNCGNGIAEIEEKKNVVEPKIGGVNQLITSPLHLILIPKYLEYIH